MPKNVVKREIERMREKINKLIEEDKSEDLSKLLKLSRDLDELILKYMNKWHYFISSFFTICSSGVTMIVLKFS